MLLVLKLYNGHTQTINKSNTIVIMIIDKPNTLLYIEPVKEKKKSDRYRIYIDALQPELDEQRRKHRHVGYGPTVGVMSNEGLFCPGMGIRGTLHKCKCGESGGNCDYLVFDGRFITSALAVHYLEWHADEIPQSEIKKLDSLPGVAEKKEELKKFDDTAATHELEEMHMKLKRTITDLLVDVEKLGSSIEELGEIINGKKKKQKLNQ